MVKMSVILSFLPHCSSAIHHQYHMSKVDGHRGTAWYSDWSVMERDGVLRQRALDAQRSRFTMLVGLGNYSGSQSTLG